MGLQVPSLFIPFHPVSSKEIMAARGSQDLVAPTWSLQPMAAPYSAGHCSLVAVITDAAHFFLLCVFFRDHSAQLDRRER